ncbi:MAG: hypothetical protein AB8B59_11500 [Maribacter sp.]
MKPIFVLVSFLVLVVGCKQPFSQTSETALAVPIMPNNKSTSVVFIAGFDEGDNTYYGNAKAYFEDTNMKLIDNLYSVHEIILWLNQNSNPQQVYDEIHIVSHSNSWLGMSLKTNKNGERITVKTLQEAKMTNEIPSIQNGITNGTKIIFHSCGLGQNQELLQELKLTFTNDIEPKVFASSYFNVFGGKYAAHYLVKPYYNFYPTAESPGPAALSKEFKQKYDSTKIDWRRALKNRHETSLGEAYSYKFNIPIDWEITFDTNEDIPKLSDRESIMDFISESSEMATTLYELNIPLEKYRWRSEIRGNKLTIKGKTTVLCVLKPILDSEDSNEYRNTNLEDHFLYQIL